VDEINADYLKGITFHYVSRMDEVLKLALTNEKVKNPVRIEVSQNNKEKKRKDEAISN
jgi:ATP-dependent Lon protease